jgi:hypothetical protein
MTSQNEEKTNEDQENCRLDLKPAPFESWQWYWKGQLFENQDPSP